MDIIGANWSGSYQPIELWENKSADRLIGGTYKTNGAWWDERFEYRFSVRVGAGDIERIDKPAEVDVDLISELKRLRIVEVASDGKVIDDSVVFQFDKAFHSDAGTRESGKLTFILKGITPAEGTRVFHVYFGGPGNVPAPEFEGLVANPLCRTYRVGSLDSWQGSICPPSFHLFAELSGERRYRISPGGHYVPLPGNVGLRWLPETSRELWYRLPGKQ